MPPRPFRSPSPCPCSFLPVPPLSPRQTAGPWFDAARRGNAFDGKIDTAAPHDRSRFRLCVRGQDAPSPHPPRQHPQLPPNAKWRATQGAPHGAKDSGLTLEAEAGGYVEGVVCGVTSTASVVGDHEETHVANRRTKPPPARSLRRCVRLCKKRTAAERHLLARIEPVLESLGFADSAKLFGESRAV